MKTKGEQNALKNDVETLNKKLTELTDEELEQVAGGRIWPPDAPSGHVLETIGIESLDCGSRGPRDPHSDRH